MQSIPFKPQVSIIDTMSTTADLVAVLKKRTQSGSDDLCRPGHGAGPGRIQRQLKLAKTFRWRPHGPVMDYFRDNALLDYFSGGFNGSGEGLLLVHGAISRGLAPSFMERMQRVAQDFAQQHQADQKLADKDREGYTLLLAMRSWEFEAFAALRR
ncbi:MAG: transcriptional regulator, family [Polaromonas sp.]|nr:transcriptional regulator, family [Polaromonas sp.]